MNHNQQIFQDTMNRIQSDPHLAEATRRMQEETRVYWEGFVSGKAGPAKGRGVDTRVWFEENLTLCAAHACAAQGGKTTVLNFANGVEPGGGVLRGAVAQEEYLCRASNLYCSLAHPNAEAFYSIHRDILNKNQAKHIFLATDAVIFSPGVTVFKRDEGYVPGVSEAYTQEYTDDWYQVDMLTCAAPMFLGNGPTIPDGDLQHLFERRIRNILEVAIEHQAQTLVLGAFGCGAFGNPPRVVAAAFGACLESERYRGAFENVVFAVPGSRERSLNRRIFEDAFAQRGR